MTEHWYRHLRHCSSRRVEIQQLPREPHRGQTKPRGHRTRRIRDSAGLSEAERLQDAGARAERDLAAIAELSQAARVVFILYPIPVRSFQTSNLATRRIAEPYEVPFVDAAKAVARIPEEEQEWLWGAHPSGSIYGEVARDLVPLVRDLSEGSSRAP